MAEFYDKPEAPDLGDPATDPPMIVRMHPDDDPRDPRARRVIKTDWTRTRPWILVTGSPAGLRLYDEDVATWPITHAVFYCAAFRHALRGAGAEQAPLVCQVAGVGLDSLTCPERDSGGRRCERIDPHVDGHRVGEHTQRHALIGNGYACASVEQTPERGDMDVTAFRTPQ